ncbi:PDDEXK family nuclease [Emydomyces testavorans]|uniref:Fanconi-associated nuclease n=1 Tax=Emydomyces testavorans TaxID=2070801 RepID=A0AAF0DLA2_9EURO|nr:PDDEXK family nuclease [Emydomyces testavorans]
MEDETRSPARKRARRLSLQGSLLPSKSPEADAELEDNNSGLLRSEAAENEFSYPHDEDDYQPSTQTELESSLPSVRADQEAIDEYEESKHSELPQQGKLNLQERYESRTWVRGKSSIYVDAFNLALQCVLDEEAHLFDQKEMALFGHWKQLPYESQYLYVRLFLRKTSAWHRIDRLGYYHDIGDMSAAIADLRKVRQLPDSLEPVEPSSMRANSQVGAALDADFRFAEDMQEITTLEEASSLLLLDELKALAKDAKIQGKNKKELLKALHEAGSSQTGLTWHLSSNLENGGPESNGANGSINQTTADGHFIKKILAHTGDCIKLSSAPLKLFERSHLVFYRSTEWTEKSLTTIILAKISRRNYPDYIVSRSNGIFSTRSALLEFEAAIRIQFDLDNALESSNLPITEKLQKVKKLSESIYPRWKKLLKEEQLKEDRLYDTGEGAYLRRFSPAWVYTRIVHKGLYALGRFKEHKKEHELLTELLEQRLFHPSRRGAWYQRKALLEEHYMWNLSPFEDRLEDAQKREWKWNALRTCEQGLEDPDCHFLYHYDLQKRIMKLEKSLNVAKREQHDFSHVMLAKPQERTIEGIRVERDPSAARAPKANGNSNTSARGRPTIWIDEREGGGECRVESMCLSWYRNNGWKGYHCEGGILRTLFGFLFYDVIFTYVPNVFQTPFQTCPLDLHTDSFYSSRISEINHRLAQISNGEAESLLRQVYERECEKQTCAIGIDWSFELSDLIEIVQCFRGEALATICKVMAQEYQQRGGGIPDLFLWSVERKEVMFVEVKSPNDRLSDTQRLWIHVLTGAGVRVELCNAVAREVRHV